MFGHTSITLLLIINSLIYSINMICTKTTERVIRSVSIKNLQIQTISATPTIFGFNSVFCFALWAQLVNRGVDPFQKKKPIRSNLCWPTPSCSHQLASWGGARRVGSKSLALGNLDDGRGARCHWSRLRLINDILTIWSIFKSDLFLNVLYF